MLDRADERLARQATVVETTGEDYATQKPTLPMLDNSLLGQNLYRLLQDYASQSIPYGDHIADYMQDLMREAALLDALWTTLLSDTNKPTDDDLEHTRLHESAATVGANGPPTKTLLTIASLDEQGRAACIRLRDLYRTLFEREFGCSTALPGSSMNAQLQAGAKSHGHVESFILDGPLASVLAPLEAGTHLFVSASEGYTPLVVSSRIWAGSISPASREAEPGGLPPVLRIYSDPGATLDIRSGLLAREKLGTAELRAFILSALPPPRELTS